MTLKSWKVYVSDVGTQYEVIIEAPNPPAARRIAEARYPGCRLSGFNEAR